MKKSFVLFMMAVVMLFSSSVCGATNFLDGNGNYPEVYSDSNGTYYIDAKSAYTHTTKDGKVIDVSMLMIKKDKTQAQFTYQFLNDGTQQHWWSMPNLERWHQIVDTDTFIRAAYLYLFK